MKSSKQVDFFIQQLENTLTKNADDEISKKQSAYLKNRFQFYGIMKPQRESLLRAQLKGVTIHDEGILIDLLKKLWSKEQREFHYIACDIAEKYQRLITPLSLSFFEEMVRSHSWWDTVDRIAANLIGRTILEYPEYQSMTKEWIKDPDMWIRRTAIIFQLRFKERTDEQILFDHCQLTMHEKEFFIRKAIGWALREYSKTSPKPVKSFIDTYRESLSPLSIREGSKYIAK